MAQLSLTRPYDRFVFESAWLLASFQAALLVLNTPAGRSRDAMLTAEMSVVRLHDAWARFSREITIMSAADKPLTANGLLVNRAPGIRKRTDVIPALLASYGRQNAKEPNWAHSRESVDAAQRLNLSNLTTVSAALGATNSPADDVTAARNFFVHRCLDTVTKVRNRPAFRRLGRVNVENIASELVGPATTRMEMWVVGLQTIAAAAVQ